jgi:hypothetical protein
LFNNGISSNGGKLRSLDADTKIKAGSAAWRWSAGSNSAGKIDFEIFFKKSGIKLRIKLSINNGRKQVSPARGKHLKRLSRIFSASLFTFS